MDKKTILLSTACVLAGLSASVNAAGNNFDPSLRNQSGAQAANPYKGMSVNAFIRSRFTGFYTLPSRSPNLASKNPRRQLLNDYYNEGKPLADGSYVNYAPYNMKNVQYIEKPKGELTRFCAANGGSLRSVAYFTKDIIAKEYINPVKAYLSAKTSLSSLKYKVSERGEVMLSDAAIEQLARNEYLRAQKLNTQHDIQGSISGYMAAVRNGAFGKFACVSQQTNNSLWHVSILPIMYKPANVDNNVHEALYIGISTKG